jgi:hypothetical protein
MSSDRFGASTLQTATPALSLVEPDNLPVHHCSKLNVRKALAISVLQRQPTATNGRLLEVQIHDFQPI